MIEDHFDLKAFLFFPVFVFNCQSFITRGKKCSKLLEKMLETSCMIPNITVLVFEFPGLIKLILANFEKNLRLTLKDPVFPGVLCVKLN